MLPWASGIGGQDRARRVLLPCRCSVCYAAGMSIGFIALKIALSTLGFVIGLGIVELIREKRRNRPGSDKRP